MDRTVQIFMVPINHAGQVITARSQTCRKEFCANLELFAWLVHRITLTAPKALTCLNVALKK
jgi:hypothetical protein